MSLFGNLQDLYKNKDHIKYIDDYDTELVTDEKGKVRKRVTYIGPYIPIKTDKKFCRALFILIDILSLASTALILFACVIRHTRTFADVRSSYEERQIYAQCDPSI